MKNWQQIPMPQLMLDNCERDPRGLPVPFVVLKDEKGKHHFKINDSNKTILCIVKSLCTICGTQMATGEKWLVGGIASAFDPKGYYIDHPMHKCCAMYALQVCPYLALRNYDSKTFDLDKLAAQVAGNVLLNNPTVDQDRLPFFVLGRPAAIQVVLTEDDFKVVPIRPFLETEFWSEGQKITNLAEVLNKIQGTKWEKYGDDIRKLPGWDIQIA